MATAHYSQLPPAANFNSLPSHHPYRRRNMHVCDSCGDVEPQNGSRFFICGGCLCSVYCSDKCQRHSWGTHRPMCQSNAREYAVAEHNVYGDPRLAQRLGNFISKHEQLIQWAGMQALQVKRMPSNVRHKALLIVLDYQPHSKSVLQFSLVETQIIPLNTALHGSSPALLDELKRREQRSRKSGGLGALVVVVQCGIPGTCQVVPVEIPRNVPWDSRDDWEPTLRKFVSEGRTDFMPISTTPQGIIYG